MCHSPDVGCGATKTEHPVYARLTSKYTTFQMDLQSSRFCVEPDGNPERFRVTFRHAEIKLHNIGDQAVNFSAQLGALVLLYLCALGSDISGIVKK